VKIQIFLYLIRHPEARGGVLHDNGGITVFDNRQPDNFQILVLENDLLIILFLPQPKGRGFDRRFVPSREKIIADLGNIIERKNHTVTLELF